MKFITFIILFSNIAFATESKTECPMIKQMHRRANPKANLSSKLKVSRPKTATTSLQ